MQTPRFHHIMRLLAVSLLLILFTGSGAWAVTYNLWADQTTVTMPDGKMVPVWGFGLDGDGDFNTADYTITVPGPALTVPPGDGLVINLKNMLPEAVSLHILGQMLSNNGGPVWDGGIAGSRPSGNVTARVRSFSHETVGSGGVNSYAWASFKPGTYLLQSGTNPAKQVQMGLYAAVTQDAAAGEAYSGEPYDAEQIILFHEFDSAIHDSVAAGTYGTALGIPSSMYRAPDYFLINGMAFDPSQPDGGGLDPINAGQAYPAGSRVLLRFINAGLQTHVPQLLGSYMTLIAEDGIPYTYQKERYGFELAAAKTMDTIFEPAGGKLPLYDARLRMYNGGAYPGGMLAYLDAAPGLPVTEINFNQFPVMPYDPANQDGSPGPTSATIEDGGATLLISGNAWKKVELTGFEVTPETVLTFDFQVVQGAEIHGIGFDADDAATNNPNGSFQLAGSQTWTAADQTFNTYSGTGWQSFSIPVGTFYTGALPFLTFINDDDASQSGSARFRNVRIYGLTAVTPPPPPPPPADTTGPVITTLAASPNPTEGAASVDLNATADDSGTGGSGIAAAEWWEGGGDPGAGNGTAMNVAGNALSAAIDVSGWATGTYTLNVRAQDGAGNWGGAASVSLEVTAPAPVTDTITITRAWYLPGTNNGRLVVFAESSDQPNVDLTVTITTDTRQLVRTMNWNANRSRYQRAINNFTRNGGAWGTPQEVLVESTGGGSATQVVEVR